MSPAFPFWETLVKALFWLSTVAWGRDRKAGRACCCARAGVCV